MKTLLCGFLVLGGLLESQAQWMVQYSVTVVNQSAVNVEVAEIDYCLQDLGGGPSFYDYLCGGQVIPANSSVTFSGAPLPWPSNTLPGNGGTRVLWSGPGTNAVAYGGGSYWSGTGEIMQVNGPVVLYTPSQTASQTVTLCATNTTTGYAELVWTYDSGIVQDEFNVCPGASDCMTETIHYNSDGAQLDSFSANVNYESPSSTNITVSLSNPASSGQVMEFDWYLNGNQVYQDKNQMPGSSDSHSAVCNLCKGDTFTGVTTATGAATTNVTGTVSNPYTDQTVLAYWTLNGQTVKQETLTPGQSDSLTEQIPMGGSSVIFAWGYTANGNFGGNSDNPFGTNNTGLSYSNNPSGGTGGFGGTGGGGTTGSTGGGTGTGGTVGGSTPTGTNAPIWTGAVFTNNINYPTAPGGGDGTDTKGLALDSTLRAVGGTLHNDNLETLKGLGVIDKDVQAVTQAILGKGTNIITLNVPANSNVWVQNFPSLGPITNLLSSIATIDGDVQTQMGVMTNDAGQQVSYLAVLTNDVWQIVKEMTNQPSFADTNGYLGGLYTNSIDLDTKFGTFTNDAGQLVAYQAALSNDLWVITQELTNMAGTLTQQVIVNFPTNMTYTFNQASNVNVMNWPSNLATESTLEGISNLLAGAYAPTNGNFSLDTNFGNYLAVTSDLAGYSVAYDGPTTYDATISAASSAAAQSGLDTQETAFDTFVANITDFSGNVLDTYPAAPMMIDFSSFGMPGGQMDLDPLHTDWGQELFAVAKKLFTWLIALSFLVKVTEEAWKAVFVIMGAHGINPQAVRTVIKNTGTSGLPGNPNV